MPFIADILANKTKCNLLRDISVLDGFAKMYSAVISTETVNNGDSNHRLEGHVLRCFANLWGLMNVHVIVLLFCIQTHGSIYWFLLSIDYSFICLDQGVETF